MNENALTGALAAIKRGLRVVPLTATTGKDANGRVVWKKHARIEKWQLMATDDPSTLRRWAQGDLTGTSARGKPNGKGNPIEHWAASLDGFFAFDADTPEAEKALREIFQEAGFPDITATFTVRTGRGGYHFLYRQPEEYALGNSIGTLAPHLDTRGGASGFIVLPGTTNPVSGKEYEVARDAEVATLPTEVAALIKERVSRAKAPGDSSPATRRKGSMPDTPLKIKTAVDWLLDHEGGVEGDGGEADAVFVGRVMGDIGLSEEQACSLVLSLYNPKCEPPWEPKDLAVKVHNGYAYREQEIGCDDPDLALSLFPQGEESGEATEEDFDALPIESMGVFYNSPPPPRRALIKDFMAYGDHLTLIYGRGGSGKTLLMVQMLRELMLKRPFLGLEAGDIGEELRPLFISGEEPRGDTHYHFWEQAKRIDPDHRGKQPDFVDCRGKINIELFRRGKNGLEPTPMFGRLMRIVKARKYNLVVIDNLARIFTGNEIDRAEVTAFGRAMDTFCMNTGAQVIILAHTNKEGEFSGSSAWEAVCRQLYQITSKTIGDTTVYTMTVEKTNEGRRGVSVSYKWNNWYWEPVAGEEMEKLEKAEHQRRQEEKQAALADASELVLTELLPLLQKNDGPMRQADIESLFKGRFNQRQVRNAISIGEGRNILRTGRATHPDANKNYPKMVYINDATDE